MAGYWPSSFFFAFSWTATKSSVWKHKRGTRLISSHPDRTSLVNKGFIIKIKQKRFRFILIKKSIKKKAEKKANCVYSTINPQQSFVFSLVWLSSAAFCDTIADIVQKLRILQVCSTRRSKQVILSGQDGPMLPIRTQDSLHIAYERCQWYDTVWCFKN